MTKASSKQKQVLSPKAGRRCLNSIEKNYLLESALDKAATLLHRQKEPTQKAELLKQIVGQLLLSNHQVDPAFDELGKNQAILFGRRAINKGATLFLCSLYLGQNPDGNLYGFWEWLDQQLDGKYSFSSETKQAVRGYSEHIFKYGTKRNTLFSPRLCCFFGSASYLVDYNLQQINTPRMPAESELNNLATPIKKVLQELPRLVDGSSSLSAAQQKNLAEYFNYFSANQAKVAYQITLEPHLSKNLSYFNDPHTQRPLAAAIYAGYLGTDQLRLKRMAISLGIPLKQYRLLDSKFMYAQLALGTGPSLDSLKQMTLAPLLQTYIAEIVTNRLKQDDTESAATKLQRRKTPDSEFSNIIQALSQLKFTDRGAISLLGSVLARFLANPSTSDSLRETTLQTLGLLAESSLAPKPALNSNKVEQWLIRLPKNEHLNPLLEELLIKMAEDSQGGWLSSRVLEQLPKTDFNKQAYAALLRKTLSQPIAEGTSLKSLIADPQQIRQLIAALVPEKSDSTAAANWCRNELCAFLIRNDLLETGLLRSSLSAELSQQYDIGSPALLEKILSGKLKDSAELESELNSLNEFPLQLQTCLAILAESLVEKNHSLVIKIFNCLAKITNHDLLNRLIQLLNQPNLIELMKNLSLAESQKLQSSLSRAIYHQGVNTNPSTCAQLLSGLTALKISDPTARHKLIQALCSNNFPAGAEVSKEIAKLIVQQLIDYSAGDAMDEQTGNPTTATKRIIALFSLLNENSVTRRTDFSETFQETLCSSLLNVQPSAELYAVIIDLLREANIGWFGPAMNALFWKNVCHYIESTQIRHPEQLTYIAKILRDHPGACSLLEVNTLFYQNLAKQTGQTGVNLYKLIMNNHKRLIEHDGENLVTFYRENFRFLPPSQTALNTTINIDFLNRLGDHLKLAADAPEYSTSTKDLREKIKTQQMLSLVNKQISAEITKTASKFGLYSALVTEQLRFVEDVLKANSKKVPTRAMSIKQQLRQQFDDKISSENAEEAKQQFNDLCSELTQLDLTKIQLNAIAKQIPSPLLNKVKEDPEAVKLLIDFIAKYLDWASFVKEAEASHYKTMQQDVHNYQEVLLHSLAEHSITENTKNIFSNFVLNTLPYRSYNNISDLITKANPATPYLSEELRQQLGSVRLYCKLASQDQEYVDDTPLKLIALKNKQNSPRQELIYFEELSWLNQANSLELDLTRVNLYGLDRTTLNYLSTVAGGGALTAEESKLLLDELAKIAASASSPQSVALLLAFSENLGNAQPPANLQKQAKQLLEQAEIDFKFIKVTAVSGLDKATIKNLTSESEPLIPEYLRVLLESKDSPLSSIAETLSQAIKLIIEPKLLTKNSTSLAMDQLDLCKRTLYQLVIEPSDVTLKITSSENRKQFAEAIDDFNLVQVNGEYYQLQRLINDELNLQTKNLKDLPAILLKNAKTLSFFNKHDQLIENLFQELTSGPKAVKLTRTELFFFIGVIFTDLSSYHALGYELNNENVSIAHFRLLGAYWLAKAATETINGLQDTEKTALNELLNQLILSSKCSAIIAGSLFSNNTSLLSHGLKSFVENIKVKLKTRRSG